jgi:Tol biopolymer transport system component
MNARGHLFFAAGLTFLVFCTPTGAVPVLGPDRWTEPVAVTEVNTDSAEEWSPFLSYDGLTLYFARVRSDTFYYGRIFEATRQQPVGPFTSVKEISGPLNSSAGHNLLPWVSPDNLRMYYHNESGGRFSLQISERSTVDDPWPQGTSILELNALGDQIQAPKLTPDERTIFFNAYDIPGGKGAYDLWMASRPDRDSLFGQVTNLAELNTTTSEWAPCVTPDGLTLYFASNRNGSSQLFRATRASLDSTFGPAEHLAFLETPPWQNNHPYLGGDGTAFYFVRQLGDDRSTQDIYVSYIPEPATLLLLGLGAMLLRKKRPS